MTVTTFQDLPLADRDRAWDGDAADKRVREWADAQDQPGIMQGARGGVDIPKDDIDRVRSHLAKYHAKMHDTPPWDHDPR